jgi:hypothetical protein
VRVGEAIDSSPVATLTVPVMSPASGLMTQALAMPARTGTGAPPKQRGVSMQLPAVPPHSPSAVQLWLGLLRQIFSASGPSAQSPKPEPPLARSCHTSPSHASASNVSVSPLACWKAGYCWLCPPPK